MKIRKRSKFAYLLGKASSRKGMGMELALLVLLTVFGCSILLVSSAMYGKDALMQKEQETLEQIERLQLDQIANEVLEVKDDLAAVEQVISLYEPDYQIVFTGNSTNFSLKISDKSNNLLLTVVQENGTIKEWTYH